MIFQFKVKLNDLKSSNKQKSKEEKEMGMYQIIDERSSARRDEDAPSLLEYRPMFF